MKISLLPKTVESGDFLAKTTVIAVVTALTVGGAVILWRLSDLLPAVFATILVAVGWRSATEAVSASFRLSFGLSLAVVALGLTATVAIALSLFGGQLLGQYDEVTLDIPAAVAMIERVIAEHPWGRFVEQFIAGVDLSKVTAPVAIQLGAILGSLGNALAFVVFGVIGAAYLAADPQGHIAGALSLAPPARRHDVARFLESSGAALRQWLVIQCYVVGMNAFFAGIPLWAFGVPAPLALATISGALAFIPYFGSIVAIIVAALVALPHGLETAGLAALAVGGASFVEGYLITPYLQSRSLSVPPVVLLFCMLGFGSLFGAMGVALAVPATVVLAVAWDVFRVSA